MNLPVKNKVEEIDLKSSDAFLPLFECIVNSIISLKKNRNLVSSDEKKIQIQITRGEPATNLLFTDANTIKSIKIIDNGEGFTDFNFESFDTAYSHFNKEFGCKGVGRFTVLAAFKSINIKSNYKENDVWKYREFSFDAENEITPLELKDSDQTNFKTVIELNELYNNSIRDFTAISVNEIAHEIMQHCLIYYLCKDLPRIEIIENDNSEVAVVNELYQKLSQEREKEFKVRDFSFTYYITKEEKENNRKNHYVHYCANSRVVGSGKSIKKVNSIFLYPIIENGKSYFLDIYVVSDYLNKKVYNSRNGFSIPQGDENCFFGQNDDITFQEIETSLSNELSQIYDSFVKETQNRSIKEVQDYIQTKAPRFSRFANNPEILKSIPPNLSDDKKEEFLYKISYQEGKELDRKIQKIIERQDITEENIKEIIKDIKAKTIYDTDCLSDYMFRRKAIIDVFKKFLNADANGQYKLEEDIHNLIIPMGVNHSEIDYETHNLWLLDDRFATYHFIASDKPITSISQKKSRLEPDVVMMESPQMFDNPISFAANPSGEISSMVIFEFKRPGEIAHQKKKKDYRWEFSELVENYFDDFLLSDDKKNYRGRPVILNKDTPKFGYVIVDVLPPKLIEFNLTKGFKKTPFGTFYRINPEINLHIEVITFEQLVKAVETRHAPFFDKLFNGKSQVNEESVKLKVI